jgi:hypothetical protein
MIAGLSVMVIAYGLYLFAAYAGVKRYTTPKLLQLHGAIYGFMNLGAFLSGFIAFTRQNFESTFPND